jgi:high potential iron-sulfur protein
MSCVCLDHSALPCAAEVAILDVQSSAVDEGLKMELTRRRIVQMGMQIASIGALPLGVMSAKAADTCSDAASEGLRTSLHYTAAGPDPAQTCSACAFFSKDDASQACGKCTIMSGPVNPKGHCDSWSAKS